MTTPMTTTKAPKMPSRMSLPAVSVEPLPEKNSESRMIAPKSAIEAAAITSCPKSDEMFPESLSTGTITPSDVETRTIAMKRGDLMKPPASKREPDDDPDRKRDRRRRAPLRASPAPQTLDVDLQAGQEEQEGQTDQGEDLDREINLHPAKPGRADDDAEHDLEDDRRADADGGRSQA